MSASVKLERRTLLWSLQVSNQPARTLHSSSSNLLEPNYVKTITASRTFCVAAPTIWRNLPDFVIAADLFCVFKSRLILCHMFDAAFKNDCLVPV